MAILLVLTTTMLLFSYVHAESIAAAQQSIVIRKVTLYIEPSNEVARGANVTLCCQAVLDEPEAVEFAILKDQNVVCTQTMSGSNALLCPLTNLKLANSGHYTCSVKFKDEEETSKVHTLTVTDAPVLHLNPVETTEGEEITLTCVAPEQPSKFYFYKDSKLMWAGTIDSTKAVLNHRVASSGTHTFHCSYKVLVDTDSYGSGNSNTVTVSVKELAIAPVLEITGPQKIYEGDQLFLTCSINTSLPSTSHANVLLKQGTKLLSKGLLKVNHSLLVLDKDSADFECEVIVKRVVKTTSKNISVAELFSAPTLTMSPAEVFQKDDMTLTCRSDSYASERLNNSQLIYSLDPRQDFLYSKSNGVFYGKAPKSEFNVSCVAKHKGIDKYSEISTLRPKVPVSIPEISVVGQAILGQPVKILCRSRTGSLPITYTLLKGYTTLMVTTVRLASEEAVFTVESASDLRSYKCEAKNSLKNPQYSKTLIAAVTVPLSNPTLIVIPDLAEITEGDHLYIICSVEGTPPVTFKWYRSDKKDPVYAITSYSNNTDYQIPVLSRNHSGRYSCEAVNPANNIVYSDFVDIQVRMALWKKALIGGVCGLAVSALVVGLVLYFKSRRAVSTEISVWTQRPPETEFFSDTVDNEESSVVTTEPDVEYTEVVHAQPVDPSRVPRRQGTDTVYSELQNSPHDMDDHDNYGSVEYTALNGEHDEITRYQSEVNSDQDLPSSSVG
ncbi:platelet endothelial cell adhesion molecule isoform X3 [Nelusetta ayraudi]|uniref:platelet endothelial cell adhesion molecule isoform X3 n=1 Tax=Nelusetta ayraudi TaxID=303726 RepID=UPI003F70B296